MKNFLIISVFVIAAFSCKAKNDDSQENARNVTINQSAVVTVDVSVKGMTCMECEKTIKTGISKIPGVVDVTASFKDGRALVQFDTTITNPEKISDVIISRGYEVTGSKLTDPTE